ncbi:unnamed protein product [Rhizoctonia solani]|uniref:Protein kinase domain-containing protein n=1 Tax=Rhizoctonia solani TaxID=456999 RepID=A0A8H3BCX8_9AGAM|nr:unnamed protein product [Rhizoctonia solani]
MLKSALYMRMMAKSAQTFGKSALFGFTVLTGQNLRCLIFIALYLPTETMIQDEDNELTGYKPKLTESSRADRDKLAVVEKAVQARGYPVGSGLAQSVRSAIVDCIRVMENSSDYMAQAQNDARRLLATLVDITGESLPWGTILDRKFVTLGNRSISQGSSYDVFVGEYFTGEQIVVKALRQRADKGTIENHHSHLKQFTQHWSKLRHESILPFYGVGMMQSPVSLMEYHIYLVSPFLKNQDVVIEINSSEIIPKIITPTLLEGSIPQKAPKAIKVHSVTDGIAPDIAQGLCYMHGVEIMGGPQGLMHSTLNVFNVLVRDSGRVVISGFGHAKVMKGFQDSETFSSGDNAEYRYMAPETLDEDPIITFGCDIWSWAMTSLEILTNKPLFGQSTRGTKVIQMITAGKRPEKEHHPKIEEYERQNEIWELFENCWKKFPGDRPSARDVVQRLKFLVQSSVNRTMSAAEIIILLPNRGYINVTADIDVKQCSTSPVCGGGVGAIYRGYLQNGLKVAIKCPKIFNTSENEGREALKAIAKEGYSWPKHQHSNILEIFGLALFRNQIALVSPWMENGPIVDYIKRCLEANRPNLVIGLPLTQDIEITDALPFFALKCAQVARGLAYLHEKATAHGDLKGVGPPPINILPIQGLMIRSQINVLVDGDGVAKIIDFGSTTMNHYSLAFSNEGVNHVFSTRWAVNKLISACFAPDTNVPSMKSPELLEADVPHASVQADVYALGMTLFVKSI